MNNADDGRRAKAAIAASGAVATATGSSQCSGIIFRKTTTTMEIYLSLVSGILNGS